MEQTIIELANKVVTDAKRILARPDFEPQYITEKAIVCNMLHEISEHDSSIAPVLLKHYNKVEEVAVTYHGFEVTKDAIDKEYVQFAMLAGMVHNMPHNTAERAQVLSALMEMQLIMYGESTT